MELDKNTVNEFFFAVKDDDLDKVKSFIEAGMDVNTIWTYGYSALILAASYGHLDMVKYLVSVGADLNIYKDDDNALAYARENDHQEVVDYLMSVLNKTQLENLIYNSNQYLI